MLAAGQGVAARFAGCFVVATGLFMIAGTALVWLPTNLPRYGKRSTAVGMQLMIGNSGGIAAPYVSISPSPIPFSLDSPQLVPHPTLFR